MIWVLFMLACGNTETSPEPEKPSPLEECRKKCDTIISETKDCKDEVSFCDPWNTVHCVPGQLTCEEQKEEAQLDWKECTTDCQAKHR